MKPSRVVAVGRRAVDERDAVAVEELIEVCRTSPRPAARGVAALFLGVIEWDDRTVPALSRLLADPEKVSLAGSHNFTTTLNEFDMYTGKVIGMGMATATLATQNAGDLSAPIEKVARVALGERAGKGKGWGQATDPAALAEIIITGDVPIDPDEEDPATIERERFRWKFRAAHVLARRHEDDLTPDLVPALVELQAEWWLRKTPTDFNQAGILLDRLQDHWKAEVIAEPIEHPKRQVRISVGQNLCRMAKRGDQSARPYLETLAADPKRGVARLGAKGLKRLDRQLGSG